MDQRKIHHDLYNWSRRAVKTSSILRNNLIYGSSFRRGHTDLCVLVSVTDSNTHPHGGVPQQDVPIVHVCTEPSCYCKRKGDTGYCRYWQLHVVIDAVVWVQEVEARAAHRSIWRLASKQTAEWRIQLYLSCVVQLQRRLTAFILRHRVTATSSRQAAGDGREGAVLLF